MMFGSVFHAISLLGRKYMHSKDAVEEKVNKADLRARKKPKTRKPNIKPVPQKKPTSPKPDPVSEKPS
jgi:hypothetical protein